MTEQAFARYFCALLVVIGLVVLCVTLADRPWLVGIVLIVVGAGVGAPLWKWHLDDVAERGEVNRLRPEQPKRASEEFPA